MGLRNYSQWVLFRSTTYWQLTSTQATYTNIENHPRLIRARDPKPVPKIVLDPKTGLPSVADIKPVAKTEKSRASAQRVSFAGSDDTDGSDTEDGHGEFDHVTQFKLCIH